MKRVFSIFTLYFIYMENVEENSKPQTMEEDDAQLTKHMKPRSEKQMIAFQQAMSKRKQNKNIKASEILVKANATKPVNQLLLSQLNKKKLNNLK